MEYPKSQDPTMRIERQGLFGKKRQKLRVATNSGLGSKVVLNDRIRGVKKQMVNLEFENELLLDFVR